jgi:pSer/pThr/pTyr-binding forkhead associated (FHA) protein
VPAAPVDDVSQTHLATRSIARVAGGWAIRLEDGREFPVTGLMLIGRNPVARPGEDVTELVSAGTQGRMVSKTHLAIGLDQRGVFIMDRGSTNGTAIAISNGSFEPCAPGDRVRVRDGQVVSFGDQTLVVRRTN